MAGKLFERGKLAIQLGDCLLQHLAVTRIAGGVELLVEAFAGKEQAVAFAVASLLGGRKRGAGRFLPLCHFLLLLFDGLALPAARHYMILP